VTLGPRDGVTSDVIGRLAPKFAVWELGLRGQAPSASAGRGPTLGALAAPASDPVTRKLVEWVLLRDSDSVAGFDRFAAFIRDNPDWPSIPLLRRRAEARLWRGAA